MLGEGGMTVTLGPEPELSYPAPTTIVGGRPFPFVFSTLFFPELWEELMLMDG